MSFTFVTKRLKRNILMFKKETAEKFQRTVPKDVLPLIYEFNPFGPYVHMIEHFR